jgi:hypothetical protein
VVDLIAIGTPDEPRYEPVIDSFNAPIPLSLGTWLHLATSSLSIEPRSRETLSFNLALPEAASPGTHYAGITFEPLYPESATPGQVSISSKVASLVELRVSGEVIEEGGIREFSTERGAYSDPNARFTVRFENRGTVALKPHGELRILNMWGKERGSLPVRLHSSSEGVSPGGRERLDIAWKSELSWLDIGRYSAELDLKYGYNDRTGSRATIIFWYLPLAPFLTISGILLLFFGSAFLFHRIVFRDANRVNKSTQRARMPQKTARKRGQVNETRETMLHKGITRIQKSDPLDRMRSRLGRSGSSQKHRIAILLAIALLCSIVMSYVVLDHMLEETRNSSISIVENMMN